MALHDCLHCGQPGRRLNYTSAIAWADYYRCDGCGQVWSSDGPAKTRTAKIVIAPKRPGRPAGLGAGRSYHRTGRHEAIEPPDQIEADPLLLGARGPNLRTGAESCLEHGQLATDQSSSTRMSNRSTIIDTRTSSSTVSMGHLFPRRRRGFEFQGARLEFGDLCFLQRIDGPFEHVDQRVAELIRESFQLFARDRSPRPILAARGLRLASACAAARSPIAPVAAPHGPSPRAPDRSFRAARNRPRSARAALGAFVRARLQTTFCCRRCSSGMPRDQ